MLSIFAIDPDVCLNLEWFRYCVEHCSACYGRAIADLPPGEWCKESLERVDESVAKSMLGPVKGQSIKRRLARARDRLIHRPGTVWQYSDSWIDDAETEHAREPFAALVSPQYASADDRGHRYSPGDLDETVDVWQTPSGIEISRGRPDFVEAILPVLLVTTEVHFLDRGFNVDSDSLYTRNYQAILRRLAAKCDVFPAVTVHCCPRAEMNQNFQTNFETEFRDLYEGVLPSGKQLTCVLWQVDDYVDRAAHPFHNRFILTKQHGVMVGYGTDSANAATDAPDNLQFIDAAVHASKLKHSRDRSHPMLSARHEFTVVGQ